MEYHLQIVFILELALAVTAIVPVVALGLHVLVCSMQGAEFVIARLAIVSRGPVLHSIHMLPARRLGPECPVAGLALVVVIHVGSQSVNQMSE
jgi:hypothetical protein